MATKLIAFAGIKGSGKDTAADRFNELFSENNKGSLTVQFAFADILKNIVHETFMLHIEEVDALKRMHIKPFNGLTLREIYQRMGEAIKSRFGQDIWTNETIKRLSDFLDAVQPDIMMVTDLRYTNEEAALRKFADDKGLDLVIIKMINTNLTDGDQHISEIQIPEIKEDYTVEASTVEELNEKIREIYNELYTTAA